MFGKRRRSRKRAAAGNRPAEDAVSAAASERRIGRYTILKPIGQGGMGTIYLGRDPVIGRQVAIKVISVKPDLSEEQARQYRERFLREAQAAGALIHPNIVAVHDIGVDAEMGSPYIVMEYVPGRDLRQVMQDSVAMTSATAIRFVLPIAAALDHAHRRGIVHRDVKPANVLIGEDGEVKIADFGVARLPGSDLTQVDQFVGSPGYVSPEQLKGEAIDGRSDLFALGVMLYQMLTGRLPFEGENVSELLYRVASEQAKPPSAVRRGVSPAFDPILARALSKDPGERYQTGKEMMEALAAVPVEEPEEIRPGSPEVKKRPAPMRGLSFPHPDASWWDLEREWRLGSLGAFLLVAFIGVNWVIYETLRGPLGRLAAPTGGGSDPVQEMADLRGSDCEPADRTTPAAPRAGALIGSIHAVTLAGATEIARMITTSREGGTAREHEYQSNGRAISMEE